MTSNYGDVSHNPLDLRNLEAIFVIFGRLGADILDPRAGGGIQSVVHALGGDRAKPGHPIILTRFEESSIFGFIARILYLFDEGKPRMFVKIVAREGKMMVECPSLWIVHVVPVRIDSQVRRRFTFANVLGSRTQYAVAQVDGILATAV